MAQKIQTLDSMLFHDNWQLPLSLQIRPLVHQTLQARRGYHDFGRVLVRQLFRIVIKTACLKNHDQYFEQQKICMFNTHEISCNESANSETGTVNVVIFTQCIFSRIFLDARKYDMSENISHYRPNRINCYMHEN